MAKRKINRPWLPKHRPFDSGRVSSRWDGYNSTKWRKFSKWFKSINKLCVIDGCGRAAYYTDHITPVLLLISQGRDPYDTCECQALCRLHGNKKTGVEGSQAKKKG